METKKAYYCNICDARALEFIDVQNKKFKHSENFCLNVMTNYKHVIMYMHIRFIRFANRLLQYIQCFETDAKVFAFPF
jgi:hypothetical protein